MKRFFQILIWTMLSLAVIAAVIVTETKHQETVCQGFDLEIIDNNPTPLIEAQDIKARILAVSDTLIGKSLGEIDLHEINKTIESIPYVATSDIRTSISGYLTVKVSLRRAIIRVINHKGLNYYIDSEGWMMPVNPGHPCRVIIASGSIRDGLTDLDGKKKHVSSFGSTSVVRKLFEMSVQIDRSPFLKRLITQIWVDHNAELEMIPLVGEYTLKFGGFEGMEEKFEKIETFYREGTGKAGWIDYRSVDLRYNNQIICSKK
ncbi:MAG: hypothetical protein ABFS05_07925 [Bacteroidota bacterium]